ncbi:peptidylprolyl isomerase [Paenibacillus sp. DYY-L-2]|uniref:peptidylprolyl isomerase n=1 Tax=Paenibacillus sp. DYY-L-2 TaxID=3447013 RepID=UPI003F506C0E
MFQSKGRSWKTLLIALSLVMAVAVMAGCGKKDDDKVVATYEGGEITAAEFDLEMKTSILLYPQYGQLSELEDFQKYIVNQAVAYEYLENKVSSDLKEDGKQKAVREVEDMKNAYGEEQFNQILKQNNITETEFKNYMVRLYTVMEGEKSKVSQNDMKEEYEANKTSYITTASVRHILIGFKDKEGKERSREDALKLAQEVKAKLDSGEDFAKLVKQYSDDGEENIQNGGLYADADVTNWVSEFRNAAVTLPLNTISDPVETTFGFHIIRVEGRVEKEFENLDAADKDLIKTSVAAQKLGEFIDGDLQKIIKKIDLPKVEKTEDSGNTTGDTSGNTDAGTNTGTDQSGNGADTGSDTGNAGTTGNESGNGSSNTGTDGK